MNLNKIKQKILIYKEYLLSNDNQKYLHHWETLKCFQDNWDNGAANLPQMYETALQNSTSRRLWQREDYFPKKAMLQLIQTDTEFMRLAFRDLFHHEHELSGRVLRFIHYCDTTLEVFRSQNKHTKMNAHYHHHETAMMYLAFRYPEYYSLYEKKSFEAFLKSVDAPHISQTHDLDRFQKITKILYNFLEKEEGLLQLSKNRFNEKHYQLASKLEVWELMSVT